METILVLSDIHSGVRRAIEVAKKHTDCQTVFYLGDGCRHLDTLRTFLPSAAFVAVRGNCDTLLDEADGTELVLEMAGHRILLCHGHTRGVKYGMGGLLVAAKEHACDIVLYGHTHVAGEFYDSDSGVYLFNPGSIGETRDGRYTYGVLSLDKKNVLFSIGEAE